MQKQFDHAIATIEAKVDTQEIIQNAISAAMYAVLFFVFSHPSTYKVVDTLLQPLFGRWVRAMEANCPTHFGVLLHSGAFFAVIFGLSFI
jgi:hypothetical protein